MSTSATGPNNQSNSNVTPVTAIGTCSKFDVEQLIKDYDPELGLAKFLSDHVRIPIRSNKGSSKSSTSRASSSVKKQTGVDSATSSSSPTVLSSSLESKHRYFQQPGQVDNRDRCDACFGIGSIICCDFCPASFHLKCFDPPIEEENLEQTWRCRECSTAGIKVENVSIDFPYPVLECESSSSLSSPSKSDTTTTHEDQQHCSLSSVTTSMYDIVKTGRARRRRLSPSSSLSTSPPESKLWKHDLEGVKMIDRDLLLVLKLLKVRCLRMNPREFSLPKQYPSQEPLVGSSLYNQRDRELPFEKLPLTETKKPICVDSEGSVPTNPITLCYECGRSCAQGPIITCDYCPAAFHLRCTDPILTALPQGRWLCPLHPHYYNPGLLLNRSWSNRVVFHEQFSKHLDVENVKQRFYDNIHKKHPPWFEAKLNNVELQVDVPNCVREMYRNPFMIGQDFQPITVKEQSEVLKRNVDADIDRDDNDNKALMKSLTELAIKTHTSVGTKRIQLDKIADQNLEGSTPEGKHEMGSLEKDLDSALNTLLQTDLPKFHHSLAVLVNLDSRQFYLMEKPWLSIGTDLELCDIVLNRSSSKPCSRVSPKHAVLFFDAKSGDFEVLNYSKYGMIVDGQRLGFDASQNRTKNKPKYEIEHQSSITESIRSFISEKSLQGSDNLRKSFVTNDAKQMENLQCECTCVSHQNGAEQDVLGWEGPAYLFHGSVLLFGCIPFVFSVL